MGDLWTFLQQTAAASAVAFFLLFLQSLFRDKLSPKWRYTIWLVLLVRLVVPAGWGVGTRLDVFGYLDTLRVWAELKLDSAWSSPWSAPLAVSGFPVLPTGGAPRSVTDWLFVLYLAGVLACALWLLWGWLGLRRMAGRAVPVTGERWERVRTLAGEFGLKPPARMVESLSAQGPFLMGVLRPTLVVPMGWRVEEKVVLHELLHRKNRDVLAGWVTALFRCVHWCNPFLWWVFDRVDNQREQRCDQQVLERLEGEDRRDYGRVLLSMAEDRALRVPGATSMANGGENIKARVQAIARFKTFPAGMGLVSLCMALVLLPNLVFGFSAWAAGSGESVNFTSPAQALAYAQRSPCTTVAGALDAWAKSVYHSAWSPYSALVCRAMVTPAEEQAGLLEEWDSTWQAWKEDQNLRDQAMDEAYRDGPLIRGAIEDGNGGYLCQMYFFRGEYEEPGEGVTRHVGWLRHTLALTKEGAGWKVRLISQDTGRVEGLEESARGELENWVLPRSCRIDLGEPPLRYWKTTWQGVEVEIWSECYLAPVDIFPYHGVDTSSLNWGMGYSGQEGQFQSLPRRSGSTFDNASGTLIVRLTNLGEETAQVVPARIVQTWSDPELTSSSHSTPGTSSSTTGPGVGYAGSDASFEQVELAPGQSLVLDAGGSGGAPVSGLDLDSCLLPTGLSGILNVNGRRLALEEIEMEVNLG